MIRIWLLLLALCGSAYAVTTPFTILVNIDAPGPSQNLFNSPPYTCNTNVYVSTSGSSGNAGTQVSPWDIVTAFNNKTFTAGTCVNIADGTYQPSTGLDITTSAGNAANPTGFVVYRAYQTMDGPHIEGTNLNNNVIVVDTNAKYIWIDGLNIDGQVTSGRSTQDCIQATGNNNGVSGEGRGSHHLYITNSILQGCGQAGFQGGNTDYQFLLHNTIYNNAWNPSFVLASGISIYEPLALQGYSGTNCSSNPGDCTTNKHLAYDDYWCATGASTSALNVCYSLVVSWNFVYNNFNPQTAGNSNSDGEGYESDDWEHRQNSCTGLTPGCPYNHNGLIMGNAFYGNGSSGYEINGNCGPTTTPSCATPGVVLIINNTAAYNGWDSHNPGTDWGDYMAIGDMVNVYFINNAVISHNYTHSNCTNCNAGFLVDQNSSDCTGTCTSSGSALQSNITNNVSLNNTSLTFPTVGTNKNLNGSDPLYTNATPMTAGNPPTLGNDDLRLQGTSPAINFAQGSFSLWQETVPGTIDVGACINGISTCPTKGDSLP